MTVELDHVFVCVPKARDQVEALVKAGFAEGSGNVHPGQGTANSRFFFDNAFFEILWAVDEQELASDVVRPTCLAQRMHWRETGACPFGVAFRHSLEDLPLWHYEAPFFPSGRTIACWSRPGVPSDPFLFHMPGTEPAVANREPLRHLPPGGEHYRIAGVDLACPEPPVLPERYRLDASTRRDYALGTVRIREADRYAMTIILASDGGPVSLSFEPGLPVAFVG